MIKEIEGQTDKSYTRRVIAVCDSKNCNNEKAMTKSNYRYHTSRHDGKYYCTDCNRDSTNDSRKRSCADKQAKGKLTRGDQNYWTFKENVLKELDLYIKKHETINGMSILDSAMYTALHTYKYNVLELVKELGINVNLVTKYHIDKRGDCNRSMSEVYFANWLIAQGFRDCYDRDVIIDKEEGNYNTDFRIKLKDSNKELRIEIWGYDEHTNGHYKDTYMKSKNIKKQIYEKHKDTLILISIEPFDMTRNEKMQQVFYEKLSPYLHLPFEIIDWKQIKCYEQLSEEDFVKELIQYGTDGKFPTKTELMEKATSRLITYAKKIGGLTYLARKYGYDSYCKVNHWNESSVFEAYIHMLNKYEKFLINNDLEKLGKKDPILVGFKDFVKENGGVIHWKILFSKYLIVNNISNDYFNPKKYLRDMLTSVEKEFNHRKEHHKILARSIISELKI